MQQIKMLGGARAQVIRVLIALTGATALIGVAATTAQARATKHYRPKVLVKRYLIASTGGTLRAKSGLELIVPPNAIASSGIASIVRTAPGVYHFEVGPKLLGTVGVRIPVRRERVGKYQNAIMHDVGGTWIAEGTAPEQSTVWVTQLSPFTTLKTLTQIYEDHVKPFAECFGYDITDVKLCVAKAVGHEASAQLMTWIEARLPKTCDAWLAEAGIGAGDAAPAAIVAAMFSGPCVGQAGEGDYHVPTGPTTGTAKSAGAPTSTPISAPRPAPAPTPSPSPSPSPAPNPSPVGTDNADFPEPAGATSGPVGLLIGITEPLCDNTYATVAVYDNGHQIGSITAGYDNGSGSGSGSGVAESIDTGEESGYPFPVGVDQVSFACFANDGSEVWFDPGFTVDMTGPQLVTSVTASSAEVGQDLTFYSGAPSGPSPCPDLNDAGERLSFLEYFLGDDYGQGFTPNPSDTTEELPVDSQAGSGVQQAYLSCSYSSPSQVYDNNGYEFAPTSVDVSP